MKRAILLFVKWPAPGKVKTRIAATVGPERAADIYRALVAAVCAQLPRDVAVIVCFDPPARTADVRDWLGPMLPQAADWVPQVQGDLGARLRAGFAAAFAAGWDQVAVIGSDCVEISGPIFDAAWLGLESHDLAVGPTDDGGYYLLAMLAEHAVVFENIRWSTAHTLADTRERAKTAGLSVFTLPALSDVDTEEDWERVAEAPSA